MQHPDCAATAESAEASCDKHEHSLAKRVKSSQASSGCGRSLTSDGSEDVVPTVRTKTAALRGLQAVSQPVLVLATRLPSNKAPSVQTEGIATRC